MFFFKNFEMTEEKVYTLIAYTYALVGLLYCFVDKYIPGKFCIIVMFIMFKMIFNYKKCTFSYMECKLRKVKRQDGYLASFLDHIVDLRNTPHKYVLYTIGLILLKYAPYRDMVYFNFR